MKTKKSPYRLISRTFTPLILLSFLLTSSKTYSLVPDFAEITYIQNGRGITVNGRDAALGKRLAQYKDVLVVSAAYSNETFAELDLIKSGVGKLWIRAKAWNGRTTSYRIPCTINQPQYSQSEITWSNGEGSACGEGMHFTNNSGTNSNLPNSQTTQIAQTKNSDKNQLFLKGQAYGSSLRYYCSSVPDYGKGSVHIAAGLTSIEEACQQSQQTCQTDNSSSSSSCSIATMGEWDLNDSDLMMSVTCADGQSSSKRVSGSEIRTLGRSSIESLIEQLLNELLGPQLGDILGPILSGAPKGCYLQVYQPDEILISPVGTQETSVLTTGLESGQIQIDVIKGQVKLRSIQKPEGTIARQGDSYIFQAQGAILANEGGQAQDSPSTDSTESQNAPNRFFLRFADAYLVHVPGTKTLQISAQGNVLSYGQDWDIRQINPYIYDLRQANWRDFYWRVNTSLQSVYRVINGAFGRDGGQEQPLNINVETIE